MLSSHTSQLLARKLNGKKYFTVSSDELFSFKWLRNWISLQKYTEKYKLPTETLKYSKIALVLSSCV